MSGAGPRSGGGNARRNARQRAGSSDAAIAHNHSSIDNRQSAIHSSVSNHQIGNVAENY
jgi:hypothetical protein